MHLQYEVVSVANVRKNKYGYVADVQCVDEHGTKLAVAKDVFCRSEWLGDEDEFEGFEKYPENVLREDASDEAWQEVQGLCSKFPGYHCTNPKVLFSLLAEGT